jgi:hypothetical protein
LVTSFPVCHCNTPQPTHAELDKVHYELAVAILQVFWCGCLPQMKEDRQAYGLGTTDVFRQILIDAFDAGRKYAPKEEAQRLNGANQVGYLACRVNDVRRHGQNIAFREVMESAGFVLFIGIPYAVIAS